MHLGEYLRQVVRLTHGGIVCVLVYVPRQLNACLLLGLWARRELEWSREKTCKKTCDRRSGKGCDRRQGRTQLTLFLSRRVPVSGRPAGLSGWASQSWPQSSSLSSSSSSIAPPPSFRSVTSGLPSGRNGQPCVSGLGLCSPGVRALSLAPRCWFRVCNGSVMCASVVKLEG